MSPTHHDQRKYCPKLKYHSLPNEGQKVAPRTPPARASKKKTHVRPGRGLPGGRRVRGRVRARDHPRVVVAPGVPVAPLPGGTVALLPPAPPRAPHRGVPPARTAAVVPDRIVGSHRRHEGLLLLRQLLRGLLLLLLDDVVEVAVVRVEAELALAALPPVAAPHLEGAHVLRIPLVLAEPDVAPIVVRGQITQSERPQRPPGTGAVPLSGVAQRVGEARMTRYRALVVGRRRAVLPPLAVLGRVPPARTAEGVGRVRAREPPPPPPSRSRAAEASVVIVVVVGGGRVGVGGRRPAREEGGGDGGREGAGPPAAGTPPPRRRRRCHGRPPRRFGHDATSVL